MSEEELAHLRQAFIVAHQAREHGNHPFAAVLINTNNEVVLTAENSVVTDADTTAHAEINLIRAATPNFTPEQLSNFTIIASAEPCAMCAAALVWANIRNVVFGLSMDKIYAMFGDPGDAPVLAIASREIFKHAPWPVQVRGPMLEEEASLPHAGFW
jgi:tRNA(Arg) A34 adenosine deaminase TadA